MSEKLNIPETPNDINAGEQVEQAEQAPVSEETLQKIGQAATNAETIAADQLDSPEQKAKGHKYARRVVNQWGEIATLYGDTEEELLEAIRDYREASNDR